MANRSSPDQLRIATAPVSLAPLIGRERELALQARAQMLTVGGFRSALRPLSDADASVTANLPVDSPFGSGLGPMTIGLQPGGDDRSQVTLPIKDHDGKDLVDPFEADGTAAMATP
jgi:hypothetical protein